MTFVKRETGQKENKKIDWAVVAMTHRLYIFSPNDSQNGIVSSINEIDCFLRLSIEIARPIKNKCQRCACHMSMARPCSGTDFVFVRMMSSKPSVARQILIHLFVAYLCSLSGTSETNRTVETIRGNETIRWPSSSSLSSGCRHSIDCRCWPSKSLVACDLTHQPHCVIILSLRIISLYCIIRVFRDLPIIGIAVTKSFGERITGNFQLSNLSVE